MKRVSRSETITAGMPNWHTQCSKNIEAIRGASAVPFIGMNLTYLLKQSTIVNMPSNPDESGKWVTKSMLIESKHPVGTGSGYSLPAGF